MIIACTAVDQFLIIPAVTLNFVPTYADRLHTENASPGALRLPANVTEA